jgi:hypothetical protein
MKAGFGLVALLIVMAIIFTLWTKHTATVVEQSKPAVQQAQQWAGQDDTGMKAKDSIVLDPVEQNGKLRYVLVDEITAGGPMEKYFGLKRNDSVIKVIRRGTPFEVKEMDANEAKELIVGAYSEQGKLVILRGGEQIELPLPKEANPAPRERNKSTLDQQLEALPGIR